MSYVLVFLACLLALPVAVLFIEVVAAVVLPENARNLPSQGERRRLAVIVPAHNESAGILPTIDDIKEQLNAGDRLIVIADNCNDDTAAVALAAGAETIERNEPSKIGKGYALDYAVRHLALNPPAIVISIDADCRLSNGTIDCLARTCQAARRPIQALDLMTAPAGSPINYRVAEFAWRLKNWVRPLGLSALGLPCHLMGTGMAFPWELICSASVASGALVEDIKLGLDMAQAGNPPLFCPLACVTSSFPSSIDGARSQRKRWEEGHIRLIGISVPRLIIKSIFSRDFALLSLALDAMVPPLSLLAMLVAVMLFVTGLAALLGASAIAFYIIAGCFIALTGSVLLAWFMHGRDVLPPNSLFLLTTFVFAKLPLYKQILSTRVASSWARAERNGNSPASTRAASGATAGSKSQTSAASSASGQRSTKP